jgi:hypothetical protein
MVKNGETMSDRFALTTKPYTEQDALWPQTGRHILAHFDEETIIVYQAYRPGIAAYAVAHQQLGGPEFRYSRMSWAKPNFLWMMFRSGWGTKENQEATLALRIRRTFFDSLLAQAVPSTYYAGQYASHEAWSEAVGRSDVRLQWDPDHRPSGAKCERRAIQLGLRGDTLRAFGTSELVEVIDATAFVREQREILATAGITALQTPEERVYRPADPTAAAGVGLDIP